MLSGILVMLHTAQFSDYSGGQRRNQVLLCFHIVLLIHKMSELLSANIMMSLLTYEIDKCNNESSTAAQYLKQAFCHKHVTTVQKTVKRAFRFCLRL